MLGHRLIAVTCQVVYTDSLMMRTDSLIMEGDSLFIPPDSLTIPPDSLIIHSDSLIIHPDSLIIHSDSLITANDGHFQPPHFLLFGNICVTHLIGNDQHPDRQSPLSDFLSGWQISLNPSILLNLYSPPYFSKTILFDKDTLSYPTKYII